MKPYKSILISVFFMFSLLTRGQNMTIKSVSLLPNDQTALKQPCIDNNGDTCALIKIKTDCLEGLEFSNPNQFISVNYSDGIYSVFVPTISRKLDFKHKDYIPIQLDMADYGIRQLRKAKTYLVLLETTKVCDLTSSVIIKTDPKWAKVIFNEKEYEATPFGTVEIPALSGRNDYMVIADNYHSQNGSITIGKNQVKTIPIKLQPITHEIVVKCNVANARVFIDNIEYGKVGKLHLPQGEHKLRIQANGYYDVESDVIIDSKTHNISYKLTKNTKQDHVFPTKVKIISQSSKIFINNKELKDWVSGREIKLMPNTYEISDETGKTKKITVSKTPMTIKL